MGRKRALIVSLENYHNPAHNLKGLGRDVAAFTEILARFGINDIQWVQDANATYQGIIDGLVNLVDGAKSGDVCVFYYTGHGVQIGGGTDNPWEALVPYEGKRSLLLPDKWIRHFLKSNLPEDVSLYSFYDSCHSAEMFKGEIDLFGLKSADDEDSWQLSKALFEDDLDNDGATQLLQSRVMAKDFQFDETLDNSVHFGAAETDNTALVRYINGERRSCFTYALDEHWRPGVSLADVEEAVTDLTYASSNEHHKPTLATDPSNMSGTVFEPLPAA